MPERWQGFAGQVTRTREDQTWKTTAFLKPASSGAPINSTPRTFQDSQDLIKKFPNLKGIFGISSVSFPGAAEAVKQAGKTGEILVTGLSTPKDMQPYVKGGEVKTVVLWNTLDLGYLTVYAAAAIRSGKLKPGATEFTAGRLGKKQISGDQILLGDVLLFTKDNIDQFDF
ncbi:MAG: substrate-binding domain-containing protein [Planctomycetaceae bacterium]